MTSAIIPLSRHGQTRKKAQDGIQAVIIRHTPTTCTTPLPKPFLEQGISRAFVIQPVTRDFKRSLT